MNGSVKLIVGLGNPGQQYEQTRHNAGADFVVALARQGGSQLSSDSKFFGLSGQVVIDQRPLRLLIPTTFMNRSGKAVAALANFYQIAPEQILVAHDELDLAPGTARFKRGGGHGGHNGLRDIIPALGNNRDFYRLRIGIGHPGHASQVSGYVLGKAAKADGEAIEESINNALRALPLGLSGDWEKAMTQLHSSTSGTAGTN